MQDKASFQERVQVIVRRSPTLQPERVKKDKELEQKGYQKLMDGPVTVFIKRR